MLSDDDAVESEAEPSEQGSDEGDLYDGYTEGDSSEASATGKKTVSTRQEKRLSKVGCRSAKNLPLTSGEVLGDLPLPLEAKLLDCLPRVLVEGKQSVVCWKHNTADGCDQPFCSCSHVLLPPGSFPASWHLLFLTRRGHHSFNGSLDKERILNLLTEEQLLVATGHTGEALDKLLFYALANSLGALVHPTNEPMEYNPIQLGESNLNRTVLWDPALAPFPLGTPSNMEAELVSRIMVGCEDAVFSGLAYDVGQIICTPSGKVLDNMCQLKAVASVLPTKPLVQLDFQLALEMYESLGRIEVHDIPSDSRLALLYVMCSRAALKGFPDSLWTLADCPLTSGCHVCSICLDAGPISYKLNLVDAKVGRFGEFDYNPGNWEHLLTRSFSEEAIRKPVVFVINSASGDSTSATRHAEGLALNKCSSLLQVVKKLAHFAATGRGKVILSERNCPAKLARKTGDLSFAREDLYRAKMEISRICCLLIRSLPKDSLGHHSLEQYTQECSAGAASPSISPSSIAAPPPFEEAAADVLPSIEHAVQQLRLDAAAHKEGFSGRSARAAFDTATPRKPLISSSAPQDSSSEDNAAISGDFQGWSVQDWKVWHDSLGLKPQRTSQEFAAVYTKHYLPMLEQEDVAHVGSSARAVLFCSQYLNRWLWVAVSKWNVPESDAVQQIVAALRLEEFGSDRQSLGPSPDLIHETFKGALSHGHLKLVNELVRSGGDPICLDLLEGRGTFNHNICESPEVLKKMLEDKVTELKALCGIVFDTRHRQVKKILLKAGVHVSSTVLAPKMAPHGGQVQKNGEDVYRMCTDCTGGPFAPNLTIHSGDHTRQKTTTTSSVSLKLIMEEQRHPDHPVRLVKDDICHAFRQVANVLRRVSKFATHAGPFVMLHLTMIFGSGSSPGLFEPLGDAVMKGLAFAPRSHLATLDLLNSIGETIKLPESWRKLSSAGELHPQVCRFVDDVLSIIAMMGTRCADHLKRLRGLIVSLLGPGGLNLTKQGEEGLPSNFKHTFGVVVDCVRRLMIAPWSKIVKLTNLARPYVNDPLHKLTLNEVEKIRGVAQHVFLCAPGLGRMLLPRLDAALSHAHKLHPGEKHPPPHCKPSPCLVGETPKEGHDRLRKVLNFVLRLALIDRGKLLQSSFEAMLPREIRTTWPGVETPDNLIHFLMDASKDALFLIDLRTGRYIQTDLTPSEKERFNAWEQGTAATTINHYELLSELFGLTLFGPFHAAAHATCIIDMINDNTAAENWTKKNRHRHAKVDQVLSIIGLSELLLKQTVVGSRVKTKENFADTGTRMITRSQDFKEGMAALEKKYGWTSQLCEIPDWLRTMGWDALSKDLPAKEWLAQASTFVQWLETEHPGLILQKCGVAGSLILEKLSQASSHEPLPNDLVADRDFPEPSISQVRRTTTAIVPPTSTQLYRSLDSFIKSFGPITGPQKFCIANDVNKDANPHQVIEAILQSQHEWYYDMVKVRNSSP